MKNLNILKAITLFSAVIFLQAFSATGAKAKAANCSELVSGEVPSVVDGERECTTSPTSLVFKIYELSLCKTAITPTTSATDKAESCSTIFESSTGQEVDLSPGKVFPLKSDISITEGTYTNGLLKMHITQSMKTQFQFPDSRTANGSNGSGAYCFSNGSDISTSPGASESHLTCHSSAFSTVANTNTFNQFGEPNSSSNFQMNQATAPNTINGVSASTNLYILDSDSTQSTGDITYSGSEPVLGSNDRTFILADQTLSSPVNIGPNTSAIDIQFNVTGSSSIIFETSSPYDVFENTFNGLIFIFSAN
jgi:hypothetical protein